MPEAFKDKFNKTLIKHLAAFIKGQYADFADQAFVKMAGANLAKLELKQRSRQITYALHQYMPSNFSLCSDIVINSLAPPNLSDSLAFDDSKGLAGWMLMPVTDFISERALQNESKHFEAGLLLLRECTKRFSAEFSVRPFLEKYPSQTLAIFGEWTNDSNVHVRRLASEGCRPYLPWGLRLKEFAEQPQLILPLLEKLKDDDSEYVRRSVANNLNDIAKDHPDLIAKLATQWWLDNNQRRQRLIKHACRTLIKNGHPTVLQLLGYLPPQLEKPICRVVNKKINIGDVQKFVLTLKNPTAKVQKLLIDYVIYHQKANGSLRPKVFKWTQTKIHPNSELVLEKSHSFKVVTTRKYYPGRHRIAVLINGRELAVDEFTLQSNQT